MGKQAITERGYTGSADWDSFIARITAYNPKQMAKLMAGGRVDHKLAMIVALSDEWLAENARTDALARVRQAQARMIEERRLTPNPQAFRPYVDANTRAMMPAIKLHRRYNGPERERDRDQATGFWRSLQSGQRHGVSIAKIVERESVSLQLRMLAHPYGPPTSWEALIVLFDMFRSMKPVPKRRPAFDPAGMTPERALAIALRVQGSSR